MQGLLEKHTLRLPSLRIPFQLSLQHPASHGSCCEFLHDTGLFYFFPFPSFPFLFLSSIKLCIFFLLVDCSKLSHQQKIPFLSTSPLLSLHLPPQQNRFVG